ncbi:MAG TPA: hypothetical protein PK014_13750 [Thermoanaerobaculia bacterium]|nr:hypothetical protein [Thermoanaerobaculia bacterium]HUM31104.1 hypothetical protein [Thermoanaerobaculia bacterium]HXK69460.1 hypothetical protein [Thermoanaerobaculia bacterium]
MAFIVNLWSFKIHTFMCPAARTDHQNMIAFLRPVRSKYFEYLDTCGICNTQLNKNVSDRQIRELLDGKKTVFCNPWSSKAHVDPGCLRSIKDIKEENLFDAVWNGNSLCRNCRYDAVYGLIADINSGTVHKLDCDKIRSQNGVEFETFVWLDQAMERGYKACNCVTSGNGKFISFINMLEEEVRLLSECEDPN